MREGMSLCPPAAVESEPSLSCNSTSRTCCLWPDANCPGSAANLVTACTLFLATCIP